MKWVFPCKCGFVHGVTAAKTREGIYSEEQPSTGKQHLEQIGDRYKRKRIAAEKVALDKRSPSK